MREKLKVGITIGDINGIGMEVIIKALEDKRVLDFFTPIVYGNSKVASYHRKAIGVQDFSFQIINNPNTANTKRPNLINCWDEEAKITLGESNSEGGKYALISLEKAMEDLQNGGIDVLVTAPIDKHNIQQQGFNFPGHTEYLMEKAKSKEVLMLMVCEDLKLGVVTGHIPLSEVSKKLHKKEIVNKIKTLNKTLKEDFWVRRPRIAVLGLNPHAGDNGLLGNEEQRIISPAIKTAQEEEDILAFGPFPADGFFASGEYKKFDAVLAMYHDQGLIPFKYIAARRGVNYTAGLPFIRTSPDHGTGLDIAGKNKASHDSLLEAIFTAIHIHNKRSETKELLANPLPLSNIEPDN